jgi:GAF domain-containing protein
MTRKPAKKQHASATKSKRDDAPRTAPPASSTIADLQQQVSVLTREVAEARQEQTATADILRVIASTPGDSKRALDAIAETAASIFDAPSVNFRRIEGEMLRIVNAGTVSFTQALPDIPLEPTNPAVRCVLDNHQIALDDRRLSLANERGEVARVLRDTQIGSQAFTPLSREGKVIGVMIVTRREVRPFQVDELERMMGFADQAVIAIENARLLNELRQRTDDLTESLEQQTATADVLRVISSSPGDLEPVFRVMLTNATRVCEAKFGIMWLREGAAFRCAAVHNVPPAFAEERRREPLVVPPVESPLGRVLETRRVVQVRDVRAEGGYTAGHRALMDLADIGGARTTAAVPLIKDDDLIGAITIYRQEVRPFTEKQVELVANFASQAIIAIENARLLNELRESLQQQTATADVLKVISRSTFDLQVVLDTLTESAARLCEAEAAAVAIADVEDGTHRYATAYRFPPGIDEYFKSASFPPGRGSIVGRTLLEGRTVHVPDIAADPEYTMTEARQKVGGRTVLGVPLLREGATIGVIMLLRRSVHPFTEKQIELVTTFADQAVIAIENVRLFDEIREKSHQLEIASQHKSQFVANMSHELRTPLAAMLGYAELMEEGIYEPLGEKSLAALARIRSNGKHLLGLINTVLDIAKIESGQFTLNMQEYSIEAVVETVRVATESLAQNKKLALTTAVAKSLPIGTGDEQRLTQVLLNLVGNAIKFTDTGEVRVTAEANDGQFAITGWTLVLASRSRSGRVSSSSSIRSMTRIRRQRAALVSASPLPSRLSKCTGAASGWTRRWAKDRPSRWSYPFVPKR